MPYDGWHAGWHYDNNPAEWGSAWKRGGEKGEGRGGTHRAQGHSMEQQRRGVGEGGGTHSSAIPWMTCWIALWQLKRTEWRTAEKGERGERGKGGEGGTHTAQGHSVDDMVDGIMTAYPCRVRISFPVDKPAAALHHQQPHSIAGATDTFHMFQQDLKVTPPLTCYHWATQHPVC